MKRHSFVIGIIGLLIVFTLAKSRGDSQSPEAAGDSPVDETTEPITGSGAAPEPYDLGPHPIPYESQTSEEQENIDRMFQQLESAQPASSHSAWGRAADQAVIAAQAEIASRAVGLEGVEQEGVVP